MAKKFALLILLSVGMGFLGRHIGLNPHQSISISIFSASILGTLFFWDFRLTFVFLGTSVLLMTKTIDLEHLIKYSSLEVILFLVGMMVLVGLLKESGFFAWLVSLILRVKNLTAKKFIVLITVMSALSACVVDEVTSIIFIVAAVFEICDYFEVNPTPFLIISVLATNIGSAGTALGNPIGILIASKSGLTFEDFLKKHPESDMAPDAKQVVDKLKSREAENAYETGKFYEARRAPESAVIYYKDIVRNYPDTEWAKKAQERLNELEKK